MTITSIRLQNYRSYRDSSFDFKPNVNIIVGPNASGKTNLLDAIHFAATGASMKPERDHSIRHDESWARIDSSPAGGDTRTIKITPTPTGVQKEINISSKSHRRMPRDMVIPVVLFEPNHLYQITTSPDLRRQLLDSILEKTNPHFTTLKNKYTKTLRQRNALLKQPMEVVRRQVFAWDIRLSELAGQYVEARRELVTRINQDTDEIYSNIAGTSHTLQLRYDSKITAQAYASGLLTKLQQRLELDCARGFTGYGPHRDDIAILLDDKDMRDVASRGETRSILLTLKIIEAQILEEVFQQKPIFLLDDVFGELDQSRRQALTGFMKNNQVFITTTDADTVRNHTKNSVIISTS